MRPLSSATNTAGVSHDYPNDRVKDQNGGAGTLVNEILIGDIIQFFQKLVIDGGITENGLPDNVTNGYQLVEALEAVVRAFSSSTSQKGTVELLTDSEALTGTDTSRCMTSANNAYVNRHRTKVMSGSETWAVTSGIGRISIPHNSDNVNVRMPSPSVFAGSIIYIVAEGLTSSSEIQTSGGSLIDTIDSNSLHICIATGSKWYIVKSSISNADGLACPFVYVNGVYFDEILKNIVDIDGEETLDISGVLEIGENKIKISEEKEETTYMKLLYFNGRLIDSDVVLKKGEHKEYDIYYSGGFAELKAVGHYKNN